MLVGIVPNTDNDSNYAHGAPMVSSWEAVIEASLSMNELTYMNRGCPWKYDEVWLPRTSSYWGLRFVHYSFLYSRLYNILRDPSLVQHTVCFYRVYTFYIYQFTPPKIIV